MYVRVLCVLALLNFVTPTVLAFINDRDDNKYAKLSCIWHGRSVACLLPQKMKRAKQEMNKSNISDDYLDWLDLRSNFDYVDSYQEQSVFTRGKVKKDFLTTIDPAANAPVLIMRIDPSDGLQSGHLKNPININKGDKTDGIQSGNIKTPVYIIRGDELNGIQSKNIKAPVLNSRTDESDGIQSENVNTPNYINQEKSYDLESEIAVNANVARSIDNSYKEYVVPKKVKRKYKNNVIDMKKYIRPKVLYMQGPSRVIPAGSLRRYFLPKRYRFDQDLSKLNTFWNNGYKWEIYGRH